jgi:hypothetical protein
MSTEWDGAQFFKGDGSGDHGCVEVAFHGRQVSVRESPRLRQASLTGQHSPSQSLWAS